MRPQGQCDAVVVAAQNPVGIIDHTDDLEVVVEIIDMNLASPISTKDIAQNQYLTPNYLSARFKEEVGVCISDYLLKRRVDLACRLLTSSQLSVLEVAGKCGMGDASYFSRMFKRVMGVGPLRYRKLAAS